MINLWEIIWHLLVPEKQLLSVFTYFTYMHINKAIPWIHVNTFFYCHYHKIQVHLREHSSALLNSCKCREGKQDPSS